MTKNTPFVSSCFFFLALALLASVTLANAPSPDRTEDNEIAAETATQLAVSDESEVIDFGQKPAWMVPDWQNCDTGPDHGGDCSTCGEQPCETAQDCCNDCPNALLAACKAGQCIYFCCP